MLVDDIEEEKKANKSFQQLVAVPDKMSIDLI